MLANIVIYTNIWWSIQLLKGDNPGSRAQRQVIIPAQKESVFLYEVCADAHIHNLSADVLIAVTESVAGTKDTNSIKGVVPCELVQISKGVVSALASLVRLSVNDINRAKG